MQVDVCHHGFDKICHIDYSEKMRTFNVEVCRNIPESNCSVMDAPLTNDIDSCENKAFEICKFPLARRTR